MEKRIKELGVAIEQQDQTLKQINNNLFMLHGAKQELQSWLNKMVQQEKDLLAKGENNG